MTQEEIIVIVLKANEYAGANRVWMIIKEVLPDVSNDSLREAIRWIYERA